MSCYIVKIFDVPFAVNLFEAVQIFFAQCDIVCNLRHYTSVVDTSLPSFVLFIFHWQENFFLKHV